MSVEGDRSAVSGCGWRLYCYHLFLSVSLLFLVNRTGIFSETEYAEISVPYGEQMRVILQDGSIVHLNSIPV